MKELWKEMVGWSRTRELQDFLREGLSVLKSKAKG